MRQSYVVNGEHFLTKSSLQERVRKILWCYRLGDLLTFDHFAFMLDLLRRHPEAEIKIGAGIAAMQVRQNPVYPSTRGFWAIRDDGSETDFSYQECIKPSSPMVKFRAACRVAVEPDTMRFKQQFFDANGDVAVCPITGEEIRFTGSHVDHQPPYTFDHILNLFIQEFDVDVTQVQLKNENEDGRIQDEFSDELLRDQWVDFHSGLATLRVVSKAANLSQIKMAN